MSPCFKRMILSIWSSMAKVLGLSSSNLIMMSSRIPRSHTASLLSAAAIYPFLLFTFALIIFETQSMMSAYNAERLSESALVLLPYLSTAFSHSLIFHLDFSSSSEMSSGFLMSGSSPVFTTCPVSLPNSHAIVT